MICTLVLHVSMKFSYFFFVFFYKGFKDILKILEIFKSNNQRYLASIFLLVSTFVRFPCSRTRFFSRPQNHGLFSFPPPHILHIPLHNCSTNSARSKLLQAIAFHLYSSRKCIFAITTKNNIKNEYFSQIKIFLMILFFFSFENIKKYILCISSLWIWSVSLTCGISTWSIFFWSYYIDMKRELWWGKFFFCNWLYLIFFRDAGKMWQFDFLFVCVFCRLTAQLLFKALDVLENVRIFSLSMPSFLKVL